jgi:hypothetical protein
MMDNLCQKVSSITDDSLSSSIIAAKVVSKEEITELSKNIPFRLEIITAIKEIKNPKNDFSLDDEFVEHIAKWINKSCIDNLPKAQVSFKIFLFL